MKNKCLKYLLAFLVGLALIVNFLSNRIDELRTKAFIKTSESDWIQIIQTDWSGRSEIILNENQLTVKVNSLKSLRLPIDQNTVTTIEEEFELLRRRWKRSIVGDFYEKPELLNDAQIIACIDKLSQDATDLYESMYKDAYRDTLWQRIPSDTNSSHITTQFRKLNTLAKAYGTVGTALYNNTEVLATIVSAIDFMTTDDRYTGYTIFGNWWDWQIGVPQEFIQILFILYDDIERQQISEYVSVMINYLPNPYQQLSSEKQTKLSEVTFIPNRNNSAANRADQALSVLGLAILTDNSTKVYETVESVDNLFKTVTSGDGFYNDGSFIQHWNIPYNGNYGCVLIRDVGILNSMIASTRWQAAENISTDYIQRVKVAFIPMIVNGEIMSFVNGRAITRSPKYTLYGFNTVRAYENVLYYLLVSSEFADEESKLVLKKAVKYWMAKNVDYYFKHASDINVLMMIKDLMMDKSIDTSIKPFSGSHVYGSMDRFVFCDNFTTIGISMYSSRISAFEAINRENIKGWHTADGMVYLYNNDQQFSSKYWPTVDWYRLPGTTVDTRTLDDEKIFISYKSVEDYVGGATDTVDAVVSMQLNKAGTVNAAQRINMNLNAKKSWFVFDGLIISLGADINGSTRNGTIQTIIENRLLDSLSTYNFCNQDGSEIIELSSQNIAALDWFLLKSSNENQSIGYMLLNNQTISTVKEERHGTYEDINSVFYSDIVYTGTYQKIIIEHGHRIISGSYAYLTYPRATEDNLLSLRNEQRFTILANTKDIQAVKDNHKKKIGVTFWNESEKGGTIAGLTVNTSVSLIYEETANHVILSVSDPKHSDEYIEIKIPQEVTEVIYQDNGIEMINNSTVIVNSTQALGKTFQLKARVA